MCHAARGPRLACWAHRARWVLPTLFEPAPSALTSVLILALLAHVPFSVLLPEASLLTVLRPSITYSPSPTKTGSLPAPPKCPTTPPIEKADPPVVPDADRSLTLPSVLCYTSRGLQGSDGCVNTGATERGADAHADGDADAHTNSRTKHCANDEPDAVTDGRADGTSHRTAHDSADDYAQRAAHAD